MQQTQYSITDIISICRNNAVLFQEDFELAKNILELRMNVSPYCGRTTIVKILFGSGKKYKNNPLYEWCKKNYLWKMNEVNFFYDNLISFLNEDFIIPIEDCQYRDNVTKCDETQIMFFINRIEKAKSKFKNIDYIPSYYKDKRLQKEPFDNVTNEQKEIICDKLKHVLEKSIFHKNINITYENSVFKLTSDNFSTIITKTNHSKENSFRRTYNFNLENVLISGYNHKSEKVYYELSIDLYFTKTLLFRAVDCYLYNKKIDESEITSNKLVLNNNDNFLI